MSNKRKKTVILLTALVAACLAGVVFYRLLFPVSLAVRSQIEADITSHGNTIFILIGPPDGLLEQLLPSYQPSYFSYDLLYVNKVHENPEINNLPFSDKTSDATCITVQVWYDPRYDVVVFPGRPNPETINYWAYKQDGDWFVLNLRGISSPC